MNNQENQQRTLKKAHRQTFWNTPKGYVIITLVVLMIVGAVKAADRSGVITVIISVATALVIDSAVAIARRYKRYFSDGGAVTGLILGLVLSSATPWYITIIVTAIGVLSKHVLKIGRKPIFNPAGFGLLVALFLFKTGQSWWGDLADLPIWCIVFVLVAGYLVVQRVNKFPQVFAFLGGYFVLLIVAALLHVGHAAYSPGDALRDPIVNSALFMAFFMLTDPPTSPAKYKDQVWFGLIVAVVSILVYILFGGLSYLLIGLAVGNVWKAWTTRRAKGKPARRALTDVLEIVN